jgi:hypothetical protein
MTELGQDALAQSSKEHVTNKAGIESFWERRPSYLSALHQPLLFTIDSAY